MYSTHYIYLTFDIEVAKRIVFLTAVVIQLSYPALSCSKRKRSIIIGSLQAHCRTLGGQPRLSVRVYGFQGKIIQSTHLSTYSTTLSSSFSMKKL